MRLITSCFCLCGCFLIHVAGEQFQSFCHTLGITGQAKPQMILTVKAPSRHKEHAIFTQQFFTDSPGIHRNVILQKTYRSFFGKLHMGALLCYQPLLYSFYVCLNSLLQLMRSISSGSALIQPRRSPARENILEKESVAMPFS